jgi:hypothetical protein
LPINGKVIGWGTGLAVDIEQFRIYPYIGAVSVNSYGNVSLKQNAFAVGISLNFGKLEVQMVLYKRVFPDFMAFWVTGHAIFFYNGLFEYRLFPGCKINCPTLVAQITVYCIRFKPASVGTVKIPESG